MSATVHPTPSGALPSRDAVMAQSRSENFPVATLAFGREARRHLLGIYGFARLVDDTGDEASGDRTILLDRIEADLSAIYANREPDHPVMRALGPTIAACAMPAEPFRRLIEANRLDQVKTRYQTFDELLDYCRLSATPVGELVLHVFGAATPERIELSDRICQALQVIEHLQDVGEDYARGRIYLPQDDLARNGVEEIELKAPTASPALRQTIAEQADRSHSLLNAGAPLVGELHGRARFAVAGFVAGGRATLAAIRHTGYNVLAERPQRTRSGFLRALIGVLVGR